MNPSELLAILRQARALIADSRNWTGRNYAEDDTGHWVPVGSKCATRFNLTGAVIRSAGSFARECISALATQLAPAPPELNPQALNASRGLTQPQALALLDWTMARLEKLLLVERRTSVSDA